MCHSEWKNISPRCVGQNCGSESAKFFCSRDGDTKRTMFLRGENTRRMALALLFFLRAKHVWYKQRIQADQSRKRNFNLVCVLFNAISRAKKKEKTIVQILQDWQ